jgi:hypothetical protein
MTSKAEPRPSLCPATGREHTWTYPDLMPLCRVCPPCGSFEFIDLTRPEWFYRVNGKEPKGPATFEEIKEKVAGAAAEAIQLRRRGETLWQPAGAILGSRQECPCLNPGEDHAWKYAWSCATEQQVQRSCEKCGTLDYLDLHRRQWNYTQNNRDRLGPVTWWDLVQMFPEPASDKVMIRETGTKRWLQARKLLENEECLAYRRRDQLLKDVRSGKAE